MESWDYKGWIKYTKISSLDTQKDWNQTLVTQINQSSLDKDVHSILINSELLPLFESLIFYDGTSMYLSGRYKILIEDSMFNDEIFLYDKLCLEKKASIKVLNYNQNGIKYNIISLLKEDLECVHMYLDDLKIPRTDLENKEYSIVGRIKQLENRFYKEMSEIETEYLRYNKKDDN